MKNRVPTVFQAAIAWGVLLSLSSCGTSAVQTVYPVEGELFVGSTPAEGAHLVFQPKDDKSHEAWPDGFPRAIVQADGRFQVSTFAAKDGAPAGNYDVLVTWPEPSTEEDSAEEDSPTRDRLQGRYNRPDAPMLHATVASPSTKLERFELKP